jgi:hypothetical protein
MGRPARDRRWIKRAVELDRLIPLVFEHAFDYPTGMKTWEVHDPPPSRPIAATLERCAELLDADPAAIRQAAAHVQPYVRVDGTKVWSLMQLERQLRPQAYGRVRGGYIARRRVRATDT